MYISQLYSVQDISMNIQYSIATFTKALEFASKKHSYQRRKNGDIPYINHPIEVADILAQSGVQDYKILSAAILHDTIEDTDTTEEELEKQFGVAIKNIVMECSDNKNLPSIDRKKNQIEHAKHCSNEAKQIKIADKLSNNYDLIKKAPNGWNSDRVYGYHLWSFLVCQNLKNVNADLDVKIDELFGQLGIQKLPKQQADKRLQRYYQTLK